MNDNAKWYVIHTYSGYEKKVAATIEKAVENRGLADLIQEIRIPMEKFSEIKDNAKREAERKLFPSYVMIKMVMNDDSWHIVRNTRGVTGFVGTDTKPIPLTEEEVAALGMEAKAEITLQYEVGDSVKITDGPLSGFIGTVNNIDKEKGCVNVTVSMFGRETPVELQFEQVTIAE